MNLSNLQVGSSAIITGFENLELAGKTRLMAMGLRPGVELTLLRKSVNGEPLQIQTDSINLGMRKVMADKIQVERI